jgi:hypothetical protein
MNQMLLRIAYLEGCIAYCKRIPFEAWETIYNRSTPAAEVSEWKRGWTDTEYEMAQKAAAEPSQ